MIAGRFIDLREREYRETWTIQKRLVAERVAEQSCDTLLAVEHPEIITVGRRFKGPIPNGAIEIERGGEATLHNPGQLVFYPILRLERKERDVQAYVRGVEECVILALAEFGLAGERRAGATGVWVDSGKRKIASIGVAISRWVTYHGVALNVNNDLKPFQRINPCGFEWNVMTSMARELGANEPEARIDRSHVVAAVRRSFEKVFNRALDCATPEELLSFKYGIKNG